MASSSRTGGLDIMNHDQEGDTTPYRYLAY